MSAIRPRELLIAIGLYRRHEEKARLEDDFIRIAGCKDGQLTLEKFKHECFRLGYSSPQATAAFKTFDINQRGNESSMYIFVFVIYFVNYYFLSQGK